MWSLVQQVHRVGNMVGISGKSMNYSVECRYQDFLLNVWNKRKIFEGSLK